MIGGDLPDLIDVTLEQRMVASGGSKPIVDLVRATMTAQAT